MSERVHILLLSAREPHFQSQIYRHMDTRTRARARTHTHRRALSLSLSHTHTEEASLRRMGLNSRGRRQASATVVYKRAYPSVCVCSISQHPSAYVSIRQRQASAIVIYKRAYPSVCVCVACVSIRQHTSAASICNCCIQARISMYHTHTQRCEVADACR